MNYLLNYQKKILTKAAVYQEQNKSKKKKVKYINEQLD